MVTFITRERIEHRRVHNERRPRYVKRILQKILLELARIQAISSAGNGSEGCESSELINAMHSASGRGWARCSLQRLSKPFVLGFHARSLRRFFDACPRFHIRMKLSDNTISG